MRIREVFFSTNTGTVYDNWEYTNEFEYNCIMAAVAYAKTKDDDEPCEFHIFDNNGKFFDNLHIAKED